MHWTNFFRQLPPLLGETLSMNIKTWSDSAKLKQRIVNLGWNEASARTVSSQIEQLLSRDCLERIDKQPWSQSDVLLAEEIAKETAQAGISNITRTQSYLNCFQKYPELHWAFLAHMVSRNAGWSMTDLHSSLVGQFMSDEDKALYYRFLERSNALIFQDAYPQLLLYMKSRERGNGHFHLLPYFHVSRFMRPFWERFWIDRNSALLTVGLIINEQNYIEHRVISNPYYQKKVSSKGKFRLFSVSGFNQSLFPMIESDTSPVTRIAGRTVSDFAGLQDRIALGKSLYAILMELQDVRHGALCFAEQVPHTGSRTDYMPHLFTWDKSKAATLPNQGEVVTSIHTEKALPDGKRLYSPKLLDIWHDTPYEPITREDWFKNQSMLHAISKPKLPLLCDITKAYEANILKLVAGMRSFSPVP